MYQKGDRVLKKDITDGVLDGIVTNAWNTVDGRTLVKVLWEHSGRHSTLQEKALLPFTLENRNMLDARYDKRQARQAQA